MGASGSGISLKRGLWEVDFEDLVEPLDEDVREREIDGSGDKDEDEGDFEMGPIMDSGRDTLRRIGGGRMTDSATDE